MQKTIVLKTSITDLSEELKGFRYVRFLDWQPEIFLSFSVGEEKTTPVRKGMKLITYPNPLIYKISKEKAVLTIELS